MDSLGVGDPQTFLLHDTISKRIASCSTSKEEVYSESSVPSSDRSVFLKNALLDDACLFAFPPPYVTCSRI